jgi:hypothetical protein
MNLIKRQSKAVNNSKWYKLGYQLDFLLHVIRTTLFSGNIPYIIVEISLPILNGNVECKLERMMQ